MMKDKLKKTCKGFYFEMDKDKNFVTIVYENKIWEPLWDGEKFVGWKRKK